MATKNIFLLFMTAFIVLFGCGSKAEMAEQSVYYYTFQDEVNTKESQEVIRAVGGWLEAHHYALMGSSVSSDWPYYTSFDLQSEVPIDSLIAPHRTTHLFKPMPAEVMNFELHSYKMEMVYLPGNELQWANVIINSYRYEDGGWHQITNLGDHRFPHKTYPTKEAFIQHLSETVIRSSFK
ncbi:MAG: hypothetical protein OEX02_10130 [Cyclobacteriaceae bacterium]|nr:hypothetical protein [Cyclobacteriaceae bacterium]